MAGLEAATDAKLWKGLLATSADQWVQFAALAFIVFFLPNSIQLMRRYRPVTEIAATLKSGLKLGAWMEALVWRPSQRWTVVASIVTVIAIIQLYRLENMTEFIYFNF